MLLAAIYIHHFFNRRRYLFKIWYQRDVLSVIIASNMYANYVLIKLLLILWCKINIRTDFFHKNLNSGKLFHKHPQKICLRWLAEES